MSDKSLILVGYSGHGFAVAEAAISSQMNLKYYSEISELHLNPFDLEYLGFEGNDSFDGWIRDYDFILGIGDNRVRKKISTVNFGERETDTKRNPSYSFNQQKHNNGFG